MRKVRSIKIVWRYPGADYQVARRYNDFRAALEEAREMKAAGYLICGIRRRALPAHEMDWEISGYASPPPDGAPRELWCELNWKSHYDWLHNPANIHNCDECPYAGDNIYGYPCGQQNCWVQCYIDSVAQ